MDAPIEMPSAPGLPAAEVTELTYRGLCTRTTAFDVDGVIADTMRLFLDIAREDFGIRHLRYEDITTYHLEHCLDLDPEVIAAVIRQILDGSHTPQLRHIAGCRRFMRRFGANGGTVRFVTARPNEEVIRAWLETTLPLHPGQIDVAATGSFEAKADVLHAHDVRVFVEDRLETCFLLSREGIAPIVFKQPWNRYPHPFREVSSWEEITALLAPQPSGE
ncbi:MAG TPA: haloacid dehalogenase [Desulfosarcina sp.]|nr:haloacid dehalogenase [Desulfosarcina sp.]